MVQMKYLGWCLCACVSVASASAAAPIAQNTGFEAEKPVEGWYVPANWSVLDGAGRKGSRALAWDCDDPKRFSYPSQRVTLEPGVRYAFGAWVKTERGKPSPQVCLGWCDATNKWIACTYATPAVDNDAHTDGWTRYEGHTPPLPANAARGILHAHMRRGDTGRVLFDDFLLAEEGSEMISYLVTSAYRNAFIRADGPIRFVAPLSLNVVRHPLNGLSAEFTFKGEDGRMVSRPADRFAADLAEMTCDAAQFACGTQQVTLCIRERSSGKVLASRSRRIIHSETPIRRHVAFDRLGRTLVDGKPFFPLGCFSGRMDAEDLAIYRKGPFNFFMPYGVVEKDDMDRYAAAGLMVAPCVMQKVHGLRYSVNSPFKTEAESHAWFRKHVADVGSHPALLAWFLVDEVPLAYVPNVASVNDLLEEIDPDHPTWTVTDKPHHARALLPCYDVIGMDPYPIGNKEDRADIGICSDWAWRTREGMFDMRPMWQVPQAFNWTWYRKDPRDIPPDVHMPTRQEMANMCWQGVAAGANGLCLYSYSSMRRKMKSAEFDASWADVCDVAREVKRMEGVLLSDGEPMALSDVPMDRLAVRAWNHGGRDWVLAVNRTKSPAKARLALPRAFRAIETALGGGASLEGASLVLDLPPLGYAFVALTPGETWAEELDRSFGIDGDRSIMKPRDCGLVNGHLSVNGWLEDVAEIRRLYAPPYFCDDLKLSFTFNGAKVAAKRHRWRPEVLVREGVADGWRISSRLYPIAGERALILEVEAKNEGAAARTMRIGHSMEGTPHYLAKWSFSSPHAHLPAWRGGVISHESGMNPAKVAYGASTWQFGAVTMKDVPPGESRKCHFALAIGPSGRIDPESTKAYWKEGQPAQRLLDDPVGDTVRRALAKPAATIAASIEAWRGRVRSLAGRVPRFETDDDGYRRLYTRSLLHFLLCEWNVDEFVVKPYYSTGGMFGCCMCSYLWNIGGPYRMWPLVAPEAIKEHLRVYMKLDLTRCYAFNPCDGGPVGPYYPINQEKMIFLIHAYVMETGDVAFLKESVDGRTVVQRVLDMALTHDDLTKDAVLADYGPRNDHLELRFGNLYNGEMPDMNLRRIVLLHLADSLCRLAGHDPKIDLVRRADALKRLCREKQWDAKRGWFVGKCSDGKPTCRWTIQMFKALGWGDWVMDGDAEAALVRHLMDPKEFLGAYGVHSLAKIDPAYDDWDVDNGGPGACVSFAPAVVDRLYADGRVKEAETILSRLKWLGDRLPYWGDSHYADRPDYRHSTPLQLNIEGGGISQTIIFGMFGIKVREDFSIEVAPHLPEGADRMSLQGVKLAGRVFDVVATMANGVEVTVEGRSLKAPLGGKVVVPAVRACKGM